MRPFSIYHVDDVPLEISSHMSRCTLEHPCLTVDLFAPVIVAKATGLSNTTPVQYRMQFMVGGPVNLDMCKQALLGCDVKCVTKYLVEGVHTVMMWVPKTYKSIHAWYLNVLQLSTCLGTTIVSQNSLS